MRTRAQRRFGYLAPRRRVWPRPAATCGPLRGRRAGAARPVLWNTAQLVGPHGILGSYDKTHIPQLGVDRFVQPGQGLYAVPDTALGRIGLQICYDWRFPEVTRSLALQGAELVAMPTCSPVSSRQADGLRNCVVVAEPGGATTTYPKVHLAGSESAVFEAGTELVLTEDRDTGLGCCYDLAFTGFSSRLLGVWCRTCRCGSTPASRDGRRIGARPPRAAGRLPQARLAQRRIALTATSCTPASYSGCTSSRGRLAACPRSRSPDARADLIPYIVYRLRAGSARADDRGRPMPEGADQPERGGQLAVSRRHCPGRPKRHRRRLRTDTRLQGVLTGLADRSIALRSLPGRRSASPTLSGSGWPVGARWC